MSLRNAPEAVRDDLPPSCKLVWRELNDVDGATQMDLVEATQLPERTVRYALNRLLEVEAIGWRWSLRDTRKKVYYTH